MRMIRSIMAAMICLALIVLAPVLVASVAIAWLAIPGVKLMSHTSDRFTLNLASYHSPQSYTWSWIVAFRRPRSSDEGRWLSCFIYPDGRQMGVQIARHEIMLLRQEQMPILAARSIS